MYLITSFVFFLFGGVMALLMRAELARPGLQFLSQRAVQPAVHDARHDHAAAVRDPAVHRLRQRDHAAADRLAGRRVPAAEHAQLLPVPLRRPDRRRRLPDPGRRRRLRLVRLRAAQRRRALARRRRRPVDHGPGAVAASAPSSAASTSSPRSSDHARARHDDVPDADLHLEHPRDVGPGAAGVPGAGRGAARRSRSTARSARTSSTPPTAARSCGSTCSGSSAIPRSTSSRCRSSASSPRSSRCSAASRSSATRAWSSRPSRSPRLSVAVWAHHMYVTGAVLLPFFAFMTMLIAVPTGVKFFNWIGTMWRGSLTLRHADALVDRLPRDVPLRRAHRHHPGLAAAGLPGVRQLLRGRPLPLRRVRHRRVRDVRRLLLLVAEVDRQDARRAARQAALLAAVHRLPHDVPHPALAGRRGHAAPLRRLPRRATASPRYNTISTIGAFILGASTLPFLWNVYKTAQARAAGRPSTTRGAGAARWSGRRPARRRGTTSSGSRGSAPSRRRSTCTTPSSRRTGVARDRVLVDQAQAGSSGDSS